MPDLNQLITESVNPDTVRIDECSTEEMLYMINREDCKVAPAVREQIPQIAKAVDLIYQAMRKGGRLFYVGAGTSGRLGFLDAFECPPTYGVDPQLVQACVAGGDLYRESEGCEDNAQEGAALISERGVTERDVVVGISASGSAAYVVSALRAARKVGAGTVGLTNNQNNGFEQECDVCIAPVCGPEVISGSTRMKAGTSQKLVLNMLTTAVMVRLGKVYGNRMVDVQVTNQKLVHRSIRMITEITGVSEPDAETWLNRTNGNVKQAIFCILSGKDPKTAQRCLEESHGVLKDALKHL